MKDNKIESVRIKIAKIKKGLDKVNNRIGTHLAKSIPEPGTLSPKHKSSNTT